LEKAIKEVKIKNYNANSQEKDLKNCENYRSISLFNSGYKICPKLLAHDEYIIEEDQNT
jgi:hypothetical protein